MCDTEGRTLTLGCVSGRRHWCISAVNAPGLCQRWMALVYVSGDATGLCQRSMALVYVSGRCHWPMSAVDAEPRSALAVRSSSRPQSCCSHFWKDSTSKCTLLQPRKENSVELLLVLCCSHERKDSTSKPNVHTAAESASWFMNALCGSCMTHPYPRLWNGIHDSPTWYVLVEQVNTQSSGVVLGE